MALEIRQQLKLSQQLVMTPQLQQAIKLLQLSRMELVDVIQQELEENPILEEAAEAPDEKESHEEPAAFEEAAEAPAEEIKEVKGDAEGMNDIDWQTYLEGYNLGGTAADSYEEDDDRPSFENLLTRKSTLTDHLMWQLNLSRMGEKARLVARRDHRQYRRGRLSAGDSGGDRRGYRRQCRKGSRNPAAYPGIRSARGRLPESAGMPAAPGEAAWHGRVAGGDHPARSHL